MTVSSLGLERRALQKSATIAIAAGMLIVCAAWARLAFADVTLLAHHDAVEQTWPWWLHNIAEVQNGRLPLWNPFANGGQSHIGEGQAFALYPPVLLVAWFGGTWAHTTGAVHTLAFLHALLAFAGGYLLGRSARLSGAGALTCGLVASLGGFFSTRAVHQLNIFMATAWTPLALVGPLRAAETGRLRWLCLTGFCLAMSLFAGHAQPAYQTGVMAGLVLAIASSVRLLPPAPPLGSLRLAVGALILALSAGALGAAQLWPMVEYQARAVRWVGGNVPVSAAAPLDYKTMAANASLDLRDFGSFVFQGLEKLPDDGSLYIGGCAAVLAFAGVVLSANRTRWLWAAVALLGVLIALGDKTPFLKIAYYLPLNRTRAPIRWLLVSHLAVAVLAGMGADAVGGITTRRARVITLGLGTLAVAMAAWMALPVLNPAHGSLGLAVGLSAAALTLAIVAIRGSRTVTAWPAVAVAGLVAAELGMGMAGVFLSREELKANGVVEAGRYSDGVSQAFGTFLRNQPGHFRFANWEAPVLENQGVLSRVPSLSGFGATRPLLIHEFQQRVYPNGWDLAGVRFLATGPSSPSLRRDDLTPVADVDGVTVLENPKAYPLAWLVGAVQVVDTPEQALDAVASDNFDGRASVVVLKKDIDRVANVRGPASGTAQILEYEPGVVRIKVRTALPGVVATSEADYPGWETRVDGELTPSINIDYAFRGIAVEPGEHEIAMTYRPRSVWGGIWISVISLVFIVGMMTFRRT